jgi:ferric-dicitrate binding protein FerR (iron transport regulator)
LSQNAAATRISGEDQRRAEEERRHDPEHERALQVERFLAHLESEQLEARSYQADDGRARVARRAFGPPPGRVGRVFHASGDSR